MNDAMKNDHLKNDRTIRISSAGSRLSKLWPAQEISWSEFCERLKIPVRSTETYKEYKQKSKQEQDTLKDVGGFVGGTFKDNKRNLAGVIGHDLITLDLDNIPSGDTETILKKVDTLGCAAAVYSTRKHIAEAPRLRIIIPTDKTTSADEYEPIARKLAEIIGISYCDKTTFDGNRLMYWPSVSSDAEYIYRVYDKPFVGKDIILGLYADWKDILSWPVVPGAEAITTHSLAKQEDPTTKKGLVGAFCREYSVVEAMERFIGGMYEATAHPDRYTYTGGTTTGGAIIYGDGKWLYSHHATDPCSGKLVNAFDLIRLHKFGELDDKAKEGTPTGKLPSYTAMSQLALNDTAVAKRVALERFNEAQQAFSDALSERSAPENIPTETTPSTEQSTADQPDKEWLNMLEVNQNGAFVKSTNNILIILSNDPRLKDKIALDEFASRILILGSVPWDLRDEKRPWTDADDAGLVWYLETCYKIYNKDKTGQMLLQVANAKKINEVKAYLDSLVWDGNARIETLLIDYLGAEDNAYTRAVMKKSLTAAVGRARRGGTKYDYMPIFAGPQGIGKSTFLANLGKSWFSDSLTSFSGKDASELIQGTWINEIGELTAMSKQETNEVKQFLSKRDDRYRQAYGRHAKTYPRRCVFFGTSNDDEFLKDATGNRRFWPVDVGIYKPTKNVWKDMPKEVDQIWAEACAYDMVGEPLYLEGEVAQMALKMQEQHEETSDKAGIIMDFLDMELPEGWEKLDLSARRQFYNGTLKLPENTQYSLRDKVCAMEIWCECFNGDKRYFKKQDSMEVNRIMNKIYGWHKGKDPRRIKIYGNQRLYYRD